MATYLELKAKAERLLQEAEELRKQEVAEVIKEIKDKMAQYGITTADLGAIAKKPAPKATAVVKYRGPNGEGWSGRGRAPLWLKEALEQGKTKEDFAV